MVEFIRIEHTIEEAKYYRYSPIENPDMQYIDGIQLLPNNPLPYIQRTNNKDGIELEDYTVDVIDICGNYLADITGAFNVVDVFQDANGKPQIEWSLTNIPFDAGGELVMLKIIQGFNDVMYTSYFRLTEQDSKFTTRWDYKHDANGTMLSVQLKVWYRQCKSTFQSVVYNSIVDGNVIRANNSLSKFERWMTSIVDKDFFELFKEMFVSRYVYADFKRAVLQEDIETPDIDDIENYFETEFNISRSNTDIYDPLYIPVVPPEPIPSTQVIVLDSVASLNNTQVEYNFHFENFAPSYVSLQFSTSPITGWIGTNTGSAISPRINTVPNHRVNSLYYRVYHEGLNIASNVLQLPIPAIVITGITATPNYFNQSGNAYTLTYNIIGYTVSGFLRFEASKENIVWTKMNYTAGNENPKTINTPFSLGQFRFFRIRDTVTGIISNTFTIIL